MIGVLVVAHAPLASALREGVLHAFPEEASLISALDVDPNDTQETTFERACNLVQRLGTSQVLILADVFGATPYNGVQRLVDGQKVRLVTGVNLPMLWRILNYKYQTLDMMVSCAITGGTQGIISCAITAPQNQSRRFSYHDSNHHDHQQ